MKFKFIGKYTNGHKNVSAWGITFYARNGSIVPAELRDKFDRHPEFERVKPRKSDDDS